MATQDISLSTGIAGQTTTTGSSRFWIIVSLLTVYIVWGTTYLASHIAMASFPPYLLMGVRFLTAGAILFMFLLASGSPVPTLKQWRNSAMIGGFILVGGTGSVALAQGVISSGLAATLIATVPLWTLLFNLFWKKRPTSMEWAGVGLGMVGVGIMTLEGNLQANPTGVLILLVASASWAFGSILASHVELPRGLMTNATQMLMAGLIFMGVSLVRGESMIATPTLSTWLALAYLVIFGALFALSAYVYLLGKVSPLLATSYTFVNPVIALLLGVVLDGEILTGSALIALPLILLGVGFVGFGAKAKQALKRDTHRGR